MNTLPDLSAYRHALAWLTDTADLDNAGDARAAYVLAALLRDALQADKFFATADEADDLATDALEALS